jgi:hypothetical protein
MISILPTRFVQAIGVGALSLMLAVAFTGCQGGEESETLKEARAMHDATHQEANRFHERLMMIQDDVTTMLDQAKDRDVMKPHYEDILAKLEAIDGKYHDWMSNQVLLPGATCNHDHDGDHDHHHGTSMDDLSDADHLDIQKAIREELDALMGELNAIHK